MDLFTPLEIRPLHDSPHNSLGRWFGCQHPERPADNNTQWDLRCRPCALHSWASIKAGLADDPILVVIGVGDSATPARFQAFDLELEVSAMDHREATIRALIDIHDLDPALLQ